MTEIPRAGRIAQSMDARMRVGMLCRTVQMCKDVAGKTSQDLATKPKDTNSGCTHLYAFSQFPFAKDDKWRNFGNHGRSLVDDGVFFHSI